uniref:Locustapyrokinin-2 n=1 Tax=Locusta migratoria TaxID=7004 RepID=LPK2_LOCMI|nr:RecName: Full=Locustapyrokinin-2; AltName: Full=FXPRL-amide; AltName: Full=Lom-PK-2 [Locusta migratoria]
QSVPTFTPRL